MFPRVHVRQAPQNYCFFGDQWAINITQICCDIILDECRSEGMGKPEILVGFAAFKVGFVDIETLKYQLSYCNYHARVDKQ